MRWLTDDAILIFNKLLTRELPPAGSRCSPAPADEAMPTPRGPDTPERRSTGLRRFRKRSGSVENENGTSPGQQVAGQPSELPPEQLKRLARARQKLRKLLRRRKSNDKDDGPADMGSETDDEELDGKASTPSQARRGNKVTRTLRSAGKSMLNAGGHVRDAGA